jgi:lambda family phage portal protein
MALAQIIDRAIEAVAPEMGMRRARARTFLKILNSGYSHSGASRSKKSMMGWVWRGGSPDDDVGANLPVLQQRSRDLYMGAPLATSAIRTIRTDTIGAGLRLKSTPDADILGISQEAALAKGREMQHRFKLWGATEHCDACGQWDFEMLQNVAMLSWLMSGDVFAVLPLRPDPRYEHDLRVMLVEADRCSNPGVISPLSPMLQILKLPNGGYISQGVEVTAVGETAAYHIARWHPLAQYLIPHGFAQWDRVAVRGTATGRRNILHVWEGERPGQKRGTPLLSPVIEEIKQLGRYGQAELDAAVVNAFFGAVVTTETPQNPLGESIPEELRVRSDDPSSLEMGPASVVGLPEGYKIDFADTKRPNVNFDGFTQAMAMQIGAALEVPSEILLKSFKSSYSASRAALLEAWKMFRMRRHWFASSFCQPIFEEVIIEDALNGRISLPGFFDDPMVRLAWLRSEWHGPAQGMVNPVQEAQAGVIRVKEGFSTRAREAAEMTGTDFESNVAQLAIEAQGMSASGLADVQTLPAQVTE